jgi:hypothetical protein
MPTRKVNISNRENPFNTEFGQDVVAISESFKARLWREGRPKSLYYESTVSNTAGGVVNNGIVTSIGCRLYIFNVTLSSDIDSILLVQTNQGIESGNDNSPIRLSYVYAKAGTPVVLNFDGEVSVPEGSAFNLAAIPMVNNSGGKLYGSVHGIEIAEYNV